MVESQPGGILLGWIRNLGSTRVIQLASRLAVFSNREGVLQLKLWFPRYWIGTPL